MAGSSSSVNHLELERPRRCFFGSFCTDAGCASSMKTSSFMALSQLIAGAECGMVGVNGVATGEALVFVGDAGGLSSKVIKSSGSDFVSVSAR